MDNKLNSMRHSITIYIGIIIIILILLSACSSPEVPPNIVLIMTDDQGYGDVRMHGNELIDTPWMDRIARNGVRMDRFMVSSVCAPTRASLLTGRYHFRAGTQWVTRGLESMHPDETTFAQVFGGNGYRTGLFGKWHNGAHYPNTPNGKGFDVFFGFSEGHTNNYFDTTLEYNGEMVPTSGYLTDVLTDSVLSFIRQNRDRPFFAYVPYQAPHSPFQVPDRYFEKYSERGFDAREASVYGMVENVDDNLARIFSELEANGLTENTIVIFMGDNGPNGVRYNAGMRGIKASVHEGGERVPFFIQWSGKIPAGLIRSEVAAHIDVLPTLVDLAGISWTPPKELDGRSFARLLLQDENDWPERMIFSHHSRWDSLEVYPGAVRTPRYRAVLEDVENWQLYDMLSDPGQEHNLAADQPELLAGLSARYNTWFREVTRNLPEHRRIPVGYEAAPVVTLPAPEGKFSGNVRFYGESGWANDWFTGWTSTNDRIWWELDVVSEGAYDIYLEYTIPAEDAGVEILASVGPDRVSGIIETPVETAFVPSPDRVPRGEVYEKETWGAYRLGRVHLPAGEQRVTLQALVIPGGAAMELKSVRLIRVDG
jgi:arylsulfatase A-like enzyme